MQFYPTVVCSPLDKYLGLLTVPMPEPAQSYFRVNGQKCRNSRFIKREKLLAKIKGRFTTYTMDIRGRLESTSFDVFIGDLGDFPNQRKLHENLMFSCCLYSDFILDGQFTHTNDCPDALSVRFSASPGTFIDLRPDSNPCLDVPYLKDILRNRGFRYCYAHRYVYIPDDVAGLFRAWSTIQVLHIHAYPNVVINFPLVKYSEVPSLQELALTVTIREIGCDFISRMSRRDMELFQLNPLKAICTFAYFNPDLSAFWTGDALDRVFISAKLVGQQLPYPLATDWNRSLVATRVNWMGMPRVTDKALGELSMIVDSTPIAVPTPPNLKSVSFVALVEPMLRASASFNHVNVIRYGVPSQWKYKYTTMSCDVCKGLRCLIYTTIEEVVLERGGDDGPPRDEIMLNFLPGGVHPPKVHLVEDNYQQFNEGKREASKRTNFPYALVRVVEPDFDNHSETPEQWLRRVDFLLRDSPYTQGVIVHFDLYGAVGPQVFAKLMAWYPRIISLAVGRDSGIFATTNAAVLLAPRAHIVPFGGLLHYENFCSCLKPLVSVPSDPSFEFVATLINKSPTQVILDLRDYASHAIHLRVRMLRKISCAASLELDKAYTEFGYTRYPAMKRAITFALKEVPRRYDGHSYHGSPTPLYEVQTRPSEDESAMAPAEERVSFSCFQVRRRRLADLPPPIPFDEREADDAQSRFMRFLYEEQGVW